MTCDNTIASVVCTVCGARFSSVADSIGHTHMTDAAGCTPDQLDEALRDLVRGACRRLRTSR
ncbi:hypothetical protein GCM10022222_42270 [Amycolatopsis ultiminotia]|uniref:C2H2-type domain-containing protein n=1 Tax=Amycolatopsis ultiminotia TaxID=543629 RepID=A0ABP6WNE6_9PSEU